MDKTIEEKDDLHEILLYEQMSTRIRLYLSSLLTLALFRIGVVVTIWSVILSQVTGRPIVVALAIAALIFYALLEAITAVVRFQSARNAIRKLKSSTQKGDVHVI